MPTSEHRLPTIRGGILYDTVRLRKPHESVFDAAWWRSKGRLEDMRGGRGSVSLLHTEHGDWVLRHYLRGGLMARLSRDRYVWLGADLTRSFVEWRLLAELQRRGLPVPVPVAARFVRHGLTYSADLITERLERTQTLASALAGDLDRTRWRRIGEVIARFHRNGACHPDLNAHNVLLRDTGEVFLIDFDRGRLRPRGAWEAQVLARLQRSLLKVAARNSGAVFTPQHWQWLTEAYHAH